MFKLKQLIVRDILEATKGELKYGNVDMVVKNISTDSRSVNEGDLFIPIEGEKFDGHAYIKDAIRGGATCILASKDSFIENVLDVSVIKVRDTREAYLDIARYYRQKFNISIIGVVGSVGKTSTKDMIASVLGTKLNVLKTKGNLNNDIGVPRTVLEIDDSDDVAIIEMGMNHKGEISKLTRVVMPDYVVISNIGVSHIENLGSRYNILKAKLEVLEGLNKSGVVFLNKDDDMLSGAIDEIGFEVVTYGIKSDCDYRAINIKDNGEDGINFDISLGGRIYNIEIKAVGMHNVYNALAGIAVGMKLGIPIHDIILGISNFKSGKMRLNIDDRLGVKIINDSYNASPDSMKAAIDVLDTVSKSRRSIAVLGDMLELGDFSKDEHRKIGEYINEKDIDCVVTVGNDSEYIAKELLNRGHLDIYSFPSNRDTTEFLNDFIKKDDVILFKGSRGMKLEEIITGLDEVRG